MFITNRGNHASLPGWKRLATIFQYCCFFSQSRSETWQWVEMWEALPKKGLSNTLSHWQVEIRLGDLLQREHNGLHSQTWLPPVQGLGRWGSLFWKRNKQTTKPIKTHTQKHPQKTQTQPTKHKKTTKSKQTKTQTKQPNKKPQMKTNHQNPKINSKSIYPHPLRLICIPIPC